MPLDVNDLVAFYASPLGDVTRRLIGRVLRDPAFSRTAVIMTGIDDLNSRSASASRLDRE